MKKRYSTAFVVAAASLDVAVMAFESCWVNQFWNPTAIRAGKAFMTGILKKYCNERDIQLMPVPPKRHSINTIKGKRGIIRSFFET